jgi:glutaredoxin
MERNIMTKVVVYTREGCHLCENVIEELQKLFAARALEISTVDITTNADLLERYKEIIPVVEINGRVRVGGSALANRSTLSAVLSNALERRDEEQGQQAH